MLDRIEDLLQQVEACPDPAVRETTRKLVQEILTFHGKSLGRMLKLAAEPGGGSLLDRFAADPQVAPLLLLHDLHPEEFGRRVERALEKVRPYLHSHGGNVELVGIDDGRVRLRLQGSCRECPSSTETLKGAVEEAILAAAPDAAGIDVL